MCGRFSHVLMLQQIRKLDFNIIPQLFLKVSLFFRLLGNNEKYPSQVPRDQGAIFKSKKQKFKTLQKINLRTEKSWKSTNWLFG